MDYKPKNESSGDSVSLVEIDGKPFSIIAVEDSSYKGTPGVKITTKEVYVINNKTIKNQPFNKFHTTRSVVVETLSSKDLRAALDAGKQFAPVYCKKILRNDDNPYFVLEPYEQPKEQPKE